MPKITSGVASAPLSQVDTPLLAVAVAQSSAVPASLADLDRAAGGVVARVIASGDFKGKRDETTLLYLSGAKPGRVLLVGLGKPGEVSRNTIRRAAAVAAKRARALGAKQLAFTVVPEARNGVSARDLGQAAVEGVAQGAWAFTELKATPDEPKPEVEGLTFVCDQKEMKEVATGQRVGDAVAAGHGLTRNLQMLPGNVCTPSYLAERAKQLADQYGFTLTVLDRAKLEQEGMGALLAVAQGSDQEPRFIVLEHRGGGDAAPVALVGKGVTFDSGGISIKPAQNMEDMKFDMSGAAAGLGPLETLGVLKPKVNVGGLIPATENLPSGHAVKPGDVVKSHFGKTIEIINTDAEGRLILCDALSYVRRFKPAAVIDIATLAGAVVVALGQVAIGAMGNDEALLAEVREAGEGPGRRRWPVPPGGRAATPPRATPRPAGTRRPAIRPPATPCRATSPYSPKRSSPGRCRAARAIRSTPTRSCSRTSRRCQICSPISRACTSRAAASPAPGRSCSAGGAARRGSRSTGTASRPCRSGATRCTSTPPASRSRRSSAST